MPLDGGKNTGDVKLARIPNVNDPGQDFGLVIADTDESGVITETYPVTTANEVDTTRSGSTRTVVILQLRTREIEYLTWHPFVEYCVEMVLARVELERAIGDEVSCLFIDCFGDELVTVPADPKHRYEMVAGSPSRQTN